MDISDQSLWNYDLESKEKQDSDQKRTKIQKNKELLKLKGNKWCSS